MPAWISSEASSVLALRIKMMLPAPRQVKARIRPLVRFCQVCLIPESLRMDLWNDHGSERIKNVAVYMSNS